VLLALKIYKNSWWTSRGKRNASKYRLHLL